MRARRKPIAAAAALLFLSAAGLAAQEQATVTLSITEIARRARSGNLEIYKAARAVERARRELAGEPEIADSTLFPLNTPAEAQPFIIPSTGRVYVRVTPEECSGNGPDGGLARVDIDYAELSIDYQW